MLLLNSRPTPHTFSASCFICSTSFRNFSFSASVCPQRMMPAKFLHPVNRHDASDRPTDCAHQHQLYMPGPGSHVFLPSNAALTVRQQVDAACLLGRLASVHPEPLAVQQLLGMSAAWPGRPIKHERTKFFAVSETPCQYCSCYVGFRLAIEQGRTYWLEFIGTLADGLHLQELRIPIEWCVAAQKEVAG